MEKETNIVTFHGHQIDPAQEVELITSLPTQETPFTIRGDFEAVRPLAETAFKAAERAEKAERVQRVRRVAETILAPPAHFTQGFLGRIAVDVKASMYDLRHGTHFLEAVRDKRDTERDLAFAQSLGLLTVDVCAKHRKALQSVRKVR